MDDVLSRLRDLATAHLERPMKGRQAAELIREARSYRWVGLYDVSASEIAAIAWTGTTAPAYPRFPVAQGLSGAAVATRQPVIVQDVAQDPRYLTAFGSTRSEAIFPVAVSEMGESWGPSTSKAIASTRLARRTRRFCDDAPDSGADVDPGCDVIRAPGMMKE